MRLLVWVALYKRHERCSELLRLHLAVYRSQARLRARVRKMLGELPHMEITSEQMMDVVDRVDETLEIHPQDTRHLLWEKMKRVFFAMRDTEPEGLDDELMSDFLAAMDGMANVLHRIEWWRKERQKLGIAVFPTGFS